MISIFCWGDPQCPDVKWEVSQGGDEDWLVIFDSDLIPLPYFLSEAMYDNYVKNWGHARVVTVGNKTIISFAHA